MLSHVTITVRMPHEVDPKRGQATLYPYMDVEVAALCRHPGSIRTTD
jgi:muconolactone delta-isomerase